MKTLWLTLAIVLIWAGTSFGQGPWSAEFYADEGLSSCELAVSTPGLVKVHVVIKGPGSIYAVSLFVAPRPACMRSAVWIADVWQKPPMISSDGDSQQGNVNHPDFFAVYFQSPGPGPCPLPLYIGWIWYSVTEPADACCAYTPRPRSVVVENFFEYPMTGSKGIIMNPDETCRCDIPVAVHETTWGGIKALYR